MIRDIISDVIIYSSVILGKIAPSDCEVVEKSDEHGKNKYTYYGKACT
jgi:hypothetical protein